MRVELDDREAELVRAALASLAEGDAHERAEECGPLALKFRAVERLTATIVDGVARCPGCGNEEFGYYEGTDQYWTPSANGEGVVSVYSRGWDSIGEGDGQPGLFCDDWSGNGCGSPIDLPGDWDIDLG